MSLREARIIHPSGVDSFHLPHVTNGSGADRTTGDIVAVPGGVCILQNNVASAAADGEGVVGVIASVPIKSADVVVVGSRLFWDATSNREMTLTTGAHNFAGRAIEAAGSGVTRGLVFIEIPQGVPGAHVADAVVAHALNATFSDTEVEAALDALGVIINGLLHENEDSNRTAKS